MGPRLRRPGLVLLALALVLLAYWLVLFTNWGRPYHGGTYVGVVFVGSVEVLAAAACLEVFRAEAFVPVRALAGALGVPLVLVFLLTLWYLARMYLAM
ncbi:hypothetical protein [Ramlibacter pallidus]|uniref:Uncharacterized protein n=1 Tax=Ramlibacter pallidus TaxID=2780087 RepID=A0ABR9S5R1_9BURK|nr:hypothetical protein [Ramlibacter pallidus]MBE7368848.1 hypothetical protein [Ramlibacter pallidus]